MKTKIAKIISLVALFITLLCVTTYAAFTMITPYDVKEEFHTIDSVSLTAGSLPAEVNFTSPGSKIDYTYNLSNTDTKDYCFSFNIVATDSMYNPLFDMVYVYKNNEYCGLLSEFISYTKDGVVHGKTLPKDSYIFKGETVPTVLTLELHNGSTGFNNNLSMSIRFDCLIKTINYSENIVVRGATDASGILDIKRAVDDLNQSGNRMLVLANNITTDSIYDIKNSGGIDLCGHTLTLNAALNLTATVDSEFKIIDSRGGGSIVKKENINLNSANAFITPGIDLTGITITSYSENLMKESIAKHILSLGSSFNATTDLLGFYKVYKGLTIIANKGNVVNGLYQKDPSLISNSVVKLTFKNGGTILQEAELNYVNSDDVAGTALNDILTNDLKHIFKYMASDNTSSVIFDVYLPTAIKRYDATISWHSSDESIMDSNGRLIKNQGLVVITGTIKLYDKVYTKKYYFDVIQQDNLTKLNILSTLLEAKLEFSKVYDKATSKPNDGSFYDLPLVTTGLCDYKNLIPDNKDLGLVSLRYEVESVYPYIGLGVSEEGVAQSKCYLSQLTLEKFAKIKMFGMFDGSDKEESTYVKVRIKIDKSELSNTIRDEIQKYLNNVDVLQNMIDTRNANGLRHEKGDFELPKEVKGIPITYTSANSLYTISDEEGKIWLRIDNSKLPLASSDIKLDATYNVESTGDIALKGLTFVVPGAVTPTNFDPLLNAAGGYNQNIYNSIRFQILTQINKELTLGLDSSGTPAYTGNPLLLAMTKDELVAFKNLPKYILINDLINAEKLVLELGDTTLILDTHNLEDLNKLIAWATGTAVGFVDDTLKTAVNEDLLWIKSDGKTTLSDGEIKMILDYLNRFPSVVDTWNTIINVNDNILSDEDIANLKQTLINDKIFKAILEWVEASGTAEITLSEWFINNRVVTDNLTEEMLPSVLRELKNNNLNSISDNEERVIIYYLQKNKTNVQYNEFINFWYQDIVRENNVINNNSIYLPVDQKGQFNFKYKSTTAYASCVDPIISKIMEWLTFNDSIDTRGNNQKLMEYLKPEEQKLFTTAELNTLNDWHYANYGYTSYYGDKIIDREFKILEEYLIRYYGFSSNSGYIQGYTDNTVTVTKRGPNSGLTKLTTLRVSDFNTQVVNVINNKFNNNKFKNFAKIVNWATNTKGTDKTTIDANSIISNPNFVNRISDLTTAISTDEYFVLDYYYNFEIVKFFMGENNLQGLPLAYAEYMIKLFWDGYVNDAAHTQTALNMNLTQDILTGSTKENILITFEGKNDFDTIVADIIYMHLGLEKDKKASSIGGLVIDNLNTISKAEFKFLSNKFNAYPEFIDELNKSITAYTYNQGKITVNTCDRSLSVTDKDKLESEIQKRIKESSLNDKEISYKFIPVDIIDDFNDLAILSYMNILKDLTLSGKKGHDLFSSNKVANKTMIYISASLPELQKLSFKYSRLSDINGIENMINLDSIDLKGNTYLNDKNHGDSKYLSDISPILKLINNKKRAGGVQIKYFNIYETDVPYYSGEYVMKRLFDENKNARIYYDKNGLETKFNDNTINENMPIKLASLLKELGVINNSFLMLPDKVYDSQDVFGEVSWSVKTGKDIVSITRNKLRVVNVVKADTWVIIEAKVTYNNIEAKRYFNVLVTARGV